MSHYSRAQNRKSFFKICGKKFDFETDEEQDTILKLLPLFRLNLQELDDQRWLEFMQDLRQDQLNHIVCFAFFSRDSGSTGGALFPRAWSFSQARASGERVR